MNWQPTKRKAGIVVLAGLLWLALIVKSMAMMLAYANAPGPAGSPPVSWPKSSLVSLDPTQPTLVMFIHPRCPCSRATVGELASLMTECQGRVRTHVFFLHPEGVAQDWSRTDIWLSAALIPGVTIHEDEAGREARRFCLETSGDSVLYDARGQLLFHGGITLARGHAGDNPGRDTVQALIRGESGQPATTPAFGCSLFGCRSENSTTN